MPDSTKAMFELPSCPGTIVAIDAALSASKKTHVIFANDSVHHTEQVDLSLKTSHDQRLENDFFPTYSPDHNRIERTWPTSTPTSPETTLVHKSIR